MISWTTCGQCVSAVVHTCKHMRDEKGEKHVNEAFWCAPRTKLEEKTTASG